MATLYCDKVDLSLLTGRWVRSDSKYDNWENYMRWFGMDDAKARNEVIEPQNHIIVACDKDKLTMIHQLPWRDGLQLEYDILMDGKDHEIPNKMFKTARSSWKVNTKATWMHTWTEKGLMCQQPLPVKEKPHVLRYTRTLLTPNEIQINVHLYEILEGGEEKEVIHTIRYFHRMPFKTKWLAAAAQFFSGTDVEKNMRTCIDWMRKAKAKGADLVVLPENSNRDRDYFVAGKPSRERAYECAETLEGAFITGLKAACRDLNIWLSVGVDLKGHTAPAVHVGVVLIRPDGEVEGIHKKHVLWDYEYTMFEAGGEPYQVFDTELGRLALMCCADGIVPEGPRVMALMGAQVLLNSLNSRGPDEMRVHIPLRSIENGVWHVASNTVGNPNGAGLLWPWTGGSEICDPHGNRVCASEEEEDIVICEVRPFEADIKKASWTENLLEHRRPELYGILTKPIDEVPCAAMYGPAPDVLPFPGPESVKTAMMQMSRVHTRQCCEWMTKRQISYAARRGAIVGVLPELWCFKRGEVQANPSEAAQYSAEVLDLMIASAKENSIHVSFTLVEKQVVGNSTRLYHTAYLIGPDGSVLATYRKAHLNDAEKAWATPGETLASVVALPALGRVALMIGDEVWIPEVSRCLALEGVETVFHPTDWDCKEAGEMAATERGGENRFHLVSVNRIDSPGQLGSQTTLAGEYLGGEPIPLMRYAQGVWCRYGVEEQVIVDLKRREPHCKMMGDNLDVLKMRWPETYEVCTRETSELFFWNKCTKWSPGDYKDEMRYRIELYAKKRAYEVLY